MTTPGEYQIPQQYRAENPSPETAALEATRDMAQPQPERRAPFEVSLPDLAAKTQRLVEVRAAEIALQAQPQEG